jgi:carboxymethylenebutenolidase
MPNLVCRAFRQAARRYTRRKMMNQLSIGRWLKRIGGGLLVLFILAVFLVGGIIIADAAFGAGVDDYANTAFPGPDGVTLQGYVATPPGDGPHPAVLMLHEWWGLNEEITVLADALAAEGYLVLVPDAYRGRVTNRVPRALYMRLTTPEEQIHADLDAALAHLRGLDEVDPARVASWGFCFGGEQSLQIGLRHPQDLAATVVFYGSPVTDPSRLEQLSQPILGVFGEEDAQIPPAEARAFEEALAAAGVTHEVIVYPGVGHAFVNSENYDAAGPPAQAWQRTLAFLAEEVR